MRRFGHFGRALVCVLGIVMLVGLVASAGGCRSYTDAARESGTITPSSYYQSTFCRGLERFNKDLSPAAAYE